MFKKKREKGKWAHLDEEKDKIMAECTMEKENPGARICNRHAYLCSSDKCPKTGVSLCHTYLTVEGRNDV